jgi:hypothetical protein
MVPSLTPKGRKAKFAEIHTLDQVAMMDNDNDSMDQLVQRDFFDGGKDVTSMRMALREGVSSLFSSLFGFCIGRLGDALERMACSTALEVRGPRFRY